MATLAPARAEAVVDRLAVSAYEIPTDAPESDGTLEWDSTTVVVVVVEVDAGGETGLGFTYGDASIARFVVSNLATCVEGSDPLSVRGMWVRMGAQIRNAVYHFAEFFKEFGIELPPLHRNAFVWGHCHQKATGGVDPEVELLKEMGVETETLKAGCCGLAGSWGFEARALRRLDEGGRTRPPAEGARARPDGDRGR